MLVTIGTTTHRKGHKTHRHVNGWAACGAGRLIGSPRPIEDSDQLCRKCAPHLEILISWEIDDMRRKRCTRRASMLERFLDSALDADELSERADIFAQMRIGIVESWKTPETTSPDRYADTLVLF